MHCMQSFDLLTGNSIFLFFNLDIHTIIDEAEDDHMMKRMEMKKENEKEEKNWKRMNMTMLHHCRSSEI